MELINGLITLCDYYCQNRGLSSATVFFSIFNDGKSFKRLKNGGDLTVRNYEKAIRWFSDHWPEGEAWPDFIERPNLPREELRPDIFGKEER